MDQGMMASCQLLLALLRTEFVIFVFIAHPRTPLFP
jgi:hypothetical protein